MSIYKKLQQARLNLVQSPLKKSGKNKFAGYEYFELGDFIPTIHNIFNDVGLCGVVSFGEFATLTVYETEGDGHVTFTTPIVHAENTKGQAIQNLGSTHTYLRRYLWLMAMEIVEHDGVDAMPQEVKPKAVEVKEVTKVVEVVQGGDSFSPVEVETNNESIEKLHEILVTFGADCQNLKELSSFWKHNQKEIDRMKTEAPDLFKDLLSKFAEYKSKFKEEK
jgi:hypothetical protein